MIYCSTRFEGWILYCVYRFCTISHVRAGKNTGDQDPDLYDVWLRGKLPLLSVRPSVQSEEAPRPEHKQEGLWGQSPPQGEQPRGSGSAAAW